MDLYKVFKWEKLGRKRIHNDDNDHLYNILRIRKNWNKICFDFAFQFYNNPLFREMIEWSKEIVMK